MDKGTFDHHVDEENNDFANWVEFVYRNKELADDLRKVKDQKSMVEVLDAELGTYSADSVPDPQVDEPSWLFSKPAKISDPPETIMSAEGKLVHAVSTVAPHKFVVKEFIWGFVVGLLVGMLTFASLMFTGVI